MIADSTKRKLVHLRSVLALSAVLIACASCVSLLTAAAAPVTGTIEKDGALYTYTVSDGEATITRIQKATGNSSATYEALVPETISYNGADCFVVAIADGAAGSASSENTELSKLVVPAKVLSIGEEAFAGCTALTTLEFASDTDGTQHLESIGQRAFYKSGIDKVVLPDTVQQVDYQAFAYCSSVQKIKFPACQTAWNDYAFDNTYNMTEIQIPEGVVRLPRLYFKNVKEIEVPSTVEGQVYLTQASGSALEKVTLPQEAKITSLNLGIGSAELNCIPEGVQSLYVSGSFSSLGLPQSLTRLIGARSSKLTNLVIPAGVESLDSYCFARDSSLASVTFEDGSKLKELSAWAFEACTALEHIELPEGIETIGAQPFDGCDALKEITIPASVTTCGKIAASCKTLERIFYEEGSLSGSNGVMSIASDCPALKEVHLPASLTVIYHYAASPLLLNCPALEGVYTLTPTLDLQEDDFKNCGDFKVYGWGAAGAVLDYAENSGHEFVPYAELDASGYNGSTNTAVQAVDGTCVRATCAFSTSSSYDYERVLTEESDYSCEIVEQDGVSCLKLTGNGVTCFGTALVPAIVDISKATISSIPAQVYTGAPCRPKPGISIGDSTLKLGRDYTLEYADNDSAGTATLTATGTGNYTGTVSANFTVYEVSATVSGNRRGNALDTARALVEASEASQVSAALIVKQSDCATTACASMLSAATGMPLVLASDDGLDTQANAALSSWGCATVYVVGTAADDEGLQSALAAQDLSCERVGGDDVAATALEVADMHGWQSDKAVVMNPQDTSLLLSAAAYATAMGSPLLFTQEDGTLGADCAAYLAKCSQTVILGGYAHVDGSVEGQLQEPRRLSGTSVEQLSAEIAQQDIFASAQAVYLTPASDATSFIPLASEAGKAPAPVLVTSASGDGPSIQFIRSNAAQPVSCKVLARDTDTANYFQGLVAELL